MNLKEALLVLKENKYLVEDTDELDDADLPIGMNSIDYHNQKAKMLSLTDKIQFLLNRQAEKTKKIIKNKIPSFVKSEVDKLTKYHKKRFYNDYEGSWFLKTDNIKRIKADNNLKNETDLLIWCYKNGFYTKGVDDIFDINDAVNSFKRIWVKRALRLLNGETIEIYRGMKFKEQDLKQNFNNIIKTCKMNLLDRNSWTFNKEVALDYAVESGDCGIVATMDCTLDMTNIYYSAWLEGYWTGFGSEYAKIGNDEINLKQMFDISNIKIENANPQDSKCTTLYKKYFNNL